MKPSYPETRRIDFASVMHGESVPDPYQWLEEPSNERANWLAAQQKLCDQLLTTNDKVAQAAKALAMRAIDFARIEQLTYVGGKYFFLHQSGLAEQQVLMVARSPRSRGRILIDPNQWSKDGTVSLSSWHVSPDASKIAYSVCFQGRNETSWHLLDVRTGQALPDQLNERPIFSTDSSGYYFARNLTPKVDPPSANVTVVAKAYYWHHRFGAAPAENDYLGEIPAVGEKPSYLKLLGDYLLSYTYQFTGHGPAAVGINKLSDRQSKGLKLFDGQWVNAEAIAAEDDRLFFNTTNGADQGRVVAVTAGADSLSAVEVIAEESDFLCQVAYESGYFVTHHVSGLTSRLSIYDSNGKIGKTVPLPHSLSVQSLAAGPKGKVIVCLCNYMQQNTFYLLDVRSGKLQVLHEALSLLQRRRDDYQISQVMVQSRDGTMIPLTLVHSKGLMRDANNPTLLQGYGGFRVVNLGGYNLSAITMVAAGGVYAYAGIRGGCEYGENWHRQACATSRQNSYDDFIACAEWLIHAGYTRPEKLAVTGASHGGLLTSVVLTQRPELFGACIPQVGLTDMIRYSELGGRGWEEEYGIVIEPDGFHALGAYSPLHQVRQNTKYPAVILVVGTNDDTVNPAHSYKLAAALQAAQAGEWPILLKLNARSGHGHGMSTSQMIDVTVAKLIFLSQALGFEL